MKDNDHHPHKHNHTAIKWTKQNILQTKIFWYQRNTSIYEIIKYEKQWKQLLIYITGWKSDGKGIYKYIKTIDFYGFEYKTTNLNEIHENLQDDI